MFNKGDKISLREIADYLDVGYGTIRKNSTNKKKYLAIFSQFYAFHEDGKRFVIDGPQTEEQNFYLKVLKREIKKMPNVSFYPACQYGTFTQIAEEFFDEINEERDKRGLKPHSSVESMASYIGRASKEYFGEPVRFKEYNKEEGGRARFKMTLIKEIKTNKIREMTSEEYDFFLDLISKYHKEMTIEELQDYMSWKNPSKEEMKMTVSEYMQKYADLDKDFFVRVCEPFKQKFEAWIVTNGSAWIDVDGQPRKEKLDIKEAEFNM